MGSVSGDLPVPGGKLRATVTPGSALNRIGSVQFSGPFKSQSEGAVRGLEALLAGATIDEAPGKIEEFFAKNPGAVSGVEPSDFLTVLSLAFMKVRLAASQAPDPEAWKKEKK